EDAAEDGLHVLSEDGDCSLDVVCLELRAQVEPVDRAQDVLLDSVRKIEVGKSVADRVIEEGLPVALCPQNAGLEVTAVDEAQATGCPGFGKRDLCSSNVLACDRVVEVSEHAADRPGRDDGAGRTPISDLEQQIYCLGALFRACRRREHDCHPARGTAK